jgi:3-oxoacyl-[acyl-carrier-protein] synthase II
MKHIVIKAIESVSALGYFQSTKLSSLVSHNTSVSFQKIGSEYIPVYNVHKEAEKEIEYFLKENSWCKKLDRVAILALLVCNKLAVENELMQKLVVNAASSRGATTTFEQQYESYLTTNSFSTNTSPTTTLGNIASNVMQLLKKSGHSIDHSMTCSGGLQTIYNAFAYLNASMCKQFLCIASEAANTNFTIMQMKKLSIYSKYAEKFYCKPLEINKSQNSFVLGESSVALLLEATEKLTKSDIFIASIAMANETIDSPTSISNEGLALKDSMQEALKKANKSAKEIDMVIVHSPGTINGDEAEYNAIESIFGSAKPVYNSKYLTGHTLAASGLLGIELATQILKTNLVLNFPYPTIVAKSTEKVFKNILINATGFGGNACSVIVSKVV